MFFKTQTKFIQLQIGSRNRAIKIRSFYTASFFHLNLVGRNNVVFNGINCFRQHFSVLVSINWWTYFFLIAYEYDKQLQTDLYKL